MNEGKELTVTELKTAVIPQLFADSSLIGEYAGSDSRTDSMNEFADLMEGSPVSKLAAKIGEIVTKLTDADPKQITEKPTWLEKITGKNIETHVRYQLARKELDDLIQEAVVLAKSVRETLKALEKMMSEHQAEVNKLEMYIAAGREFLSENSEIGIPQKGSLDFDNPRERFERKLTNLATLLTSHSMSVAQMKLTRAQSVDMIDRFNETHTVLVPVWRQHSLSLLTTKNMNPAMVAEATKAHSALMKSLAMSADSTPN